MSNNSPRAFITGITGQDGSYLTELLLAKGYEVHGLIRRSSTFNTARIEHLYSDPHELGTRLKLHYGDLTDANGLVRLVREVRPNEVYNLGAQSHVRVSFFQPVYTADAGAIGTLKLLEAVRDFQDSSGQQVRFYQASSSEMFGKVQEVPQSERTPFYPRSPYAVAKLFGHWITVNYRESFGLFAVSGILFNHESPRRGREFVSRHVSEGVARIKLGLADELPIGNLDAHRDWGYAPEYVDAMWRMLQHPEPHDYVIGTGRQSSVRDFVEIAFAHVGLDPSDFLRVDPARLRPAEVDTLLADPSRAKRELGWESRTAFPDLVQIMVEADLEAQERASGRRRNGPGTR